MSSPASQSVPPAAPATQVQDHAEKISATPLLPEKGQNAQAVSAEMSAQSQDSAKPTMISAPSQSNPLPPPKAQAQSELQSVPPASSNSKDEPQPMSSEQNDIKGLAKLHLAPGATKPSGPLTSFTPAHRNLPPVHPHARTAQKAHRAKRRRLTGLGKRWFPAAEQFVREIPPVPCFSDPKRQVPMRDMRGWITIISKNSKKLVWDRFMGALEQDDLADGGDLEICRYILSSVIHEAQDPNSSKTQTRQAVNNAIKRELTLPKSEGQKGRGQTFRELFRLKATQAGFRTSPLSGSCTEDDVIMHDKSEITRPRMPDSAMTCTNATGNPSMEMQVHDRMFSAPIYGHRSRHFLTKKTEDALLEEEAVYMLLQAAAPKLLNSQLQKCERTPDGEIAYWKSSSLNRADHMAMFIKSLVDKRCIHDLKRILVEFRWIVKHAESSRSGILLLVKYGYDVLLAVKTPALNVFEREGYRLIRNALMLIRPVLQSAICEPAEPDNLRSQLATQLYGRLLKDSVRFSVISTLLESIRMYASEPWLRPLNPCFESPRTDIAMAIRSGVNAVPSAIAMSKDGELVVTAGDEDKCSVRVWDISSGKCVSNLRGKHKTSVLYLSITPDKRHVISCAGAELMFWDIMDDKGKYIERVTDENPPQKTEPASLVLSTAVLPGSKRAVVAHETVMRIWDISKRKIEDKFNENSSTIFSLDVTIDGKYVVSGDLDHWVRVWDMSTLQKVYELNTECSVFSVSVMQSEIPNGGADETMKVVTGSLGSLKVWTLPPLGIKVQTGEKSEELPVDQSELRFSSVQCSGTKIIYSGSDDGVVRMWKLHGEGDWRPTMIINDAHVRLGGSGKSIRSGGAAPAGGSSAFIAVSEDGKKVASSTTRPLIPVYDIGQYEETLRGQRENLRQPYFPCRPETVHYTDMYMGDPVRAPSGPGQQSEPRHGLPTDLGAYFRVGADDDLRIVKNESGTPANVLKLMVEDKHERIITFDETIQSARCGSFHTMDSEQAMRKGVAVRFADKSLAFFEVKLKTRTGV